MYSRAACGKTRQDASHTGLSLLIGRIGRLSNKCSTWTRRRWVGHRDCCTAAPIREAARTAKGSRSRNRIDWNSVPVMLVLKLATITRTRASTTSANAGLSTCPAIRAAEKPAIQTTKLATPIANPARPMYELSRNIQYRQGAAARTSAWIFRSIEAVKDRDTNG